MPLRETLLMMQVRFDPLSLAPSSLSLLSLSLLSLPR